VMKNEGENPSFIPFHDLILHFRSCKKADKAKILKSYCFTLICQIKTLIKLK
jgi:hypothetical protein